MATNPTELEQSATDESPKPALGLPTLTMITNDSTDAPVCGPDGCC